MKCNLNDLIEQTKYNAMIEEEYKKEERLKRYEAFEEEQRAKNKDLNTLLNAYGEKLQKDAQAKLDKELKQAKAENDLKLENEIRRRQGARTVEQMANRESLREMLASI